MRFQGNFKFPDLIGVRVKAVFVRSKHGDILSLKVAKTRLVVIGCTGILRPRLSTKQRDRKLTGGHDMPDETMDQVAREWLASRDVIIRFLKELRPDMSQEHLEHNAAALIARLAQHEPPILLEMMKPLGQLFGPTGRK
jgi:hypothetical protein